MENLRQAVDRGSYLYDYFTEGYFDRIMTGFGDEDVYDLLGVLDIRDLKILKEEAGTRTVSFDATLIYATARANEVMGRVTITGDLALDYSSDFEISKVDYDVENVLEIL